jgi:membrane associated rhomboid family serine protease
MTRWVGRLIAANIGVYLLQLALPWVTGAGMFVPAWVLARPWTPVTAMFLHDPNGLLHILFNMVALWMFGPRVEARIGGRRFLGLYFVSGLAGAAACFFQPQQAVIGASGAIFGVSLAYARYWPHDKVLIYGILPMTTRTMVVLYAVWSMLGAFGFVESGVAHLGHLGGFVGGYLYCRYLERFTGARSFRARAEHGWEQGLREQAAAELTTLARWARIPGEMLHPNNREELERLRAKLATSGIRTLTPDERAYLDRLAALTGV